VEKCYEEKKYQEKQFEPLLLLGTSHG